MVAVFEFMLYDLDESSVAATNHLQIEILFGLRRCIKVPDRGALSFLPFSI
jgi:hypothetical protein